MGKILKAQEIRRGFMLDHIYGFDEARLHPPDLDGLKQALKTLPKRYKRLLVAFWGVGGGRPRSLDELAAVEGCTRERIRQIIAKTYRMLRHPSRRDLIFHE